MITNPTDQKSLRSTQQINDVRLKNKTINKKRNNNNQKYYKNCIIICSTSIILNLNHHLIIHQPPSHCLTIIQPSSNHHRTNKKRHKDKIFQKTANRTDPPQKLPHCIAEIGKSMILLLSSLKYGNQQVLADCAGVYV